MRNLNGGIIKHIKKIFAFTLAEVLITIGVIGVVAAITIPSLITKSHRIIVENRLKDSYSIISNAVKMAEEEWGVGFEPTDGLTSTGWSPRSSKFVFDKYFRPFMKINYEYSQDDCVELSKAYGQNPNSGMYIDYNGACYSLPNGTSIIFWAGRKDIDSPYLMTVQFRINPAKKKQIDGIDVFGFQIVNSNNGLVVTSGLEQIGFEISDEKLIEACGSDSDRIPVNGYWWGRNAFCLELIKRNGWKIPANYPLKF